MTGAGHLCHFVQGATPEISILVFDVVWAPESESLAGRGRAAHRCSRIGARCGEATSYNVRLPNGAHQFSMARQLQACLDSLNCMVGTDTYSARSLSVWMLVVRNPSTKVR